MGDRTGAPYASPQSRSSVTVLHRVEPSTPAWGLSRKPCRQRRVAAADVVDRQMRAQAAAANPVTSRQAAKRARRGWW